MRYEQIKPLLGEDILDEVKMSPSALQKFANSPEAEGMLMGIEFEMCVPNVAVDDDDGDGEYDYDMDERCYDIDDIVNFFQNGEMSNLSSNGAQRLREKMWDQYLEWQSEKINDDLDSDELEDRIRSRLEDDLDVEDYMDPAAEELGIDPRDDDESEDKVRARARELMDEALDELMGNSRDYERAYDDIREEMYDEMRDDGNYDQESWLRDLGIDYMSEAEREWGLDWPHWRSYGSGGELDVDQVGDEFAQAMGLDRVNTSTNYHGGTRDGQHWIIEPDSSIDADEGDGGLEFVSPPMPIKDGLEMVKRFYEWARENGCYTNDSTGLHMNISVPDMTVEKLDYVKLALFLGDEHVLKQFGRQYNTYAKSAMSKIKDRIKPEEVPTVLNQMKQHLNSLASKTIHSGITDKYTSINTKSNYVEFRGPGGDYLDKDPFEIANTVLRLAMSLRIATEPESYKQEYAKKLYKLVEQEKDPDNSVKLFSQYAMGEMPREDLLARLKFAKKEREIAKTKKPAAERLASTPEFSRATASLSADWSDKANKITTMTESDLEYLKAGITAGDYDQELTGDQKRLLLRGIESELEYRKAQGDLKTYWVFFKDGTGGKQAVFANNENEAIIKGGKNLRLSREDSITRLRAEEKTEPLDLSTMSDAEFNHQRRDLPTFTLEKFVADIKEKERSSLEKALDSVKRRAITGSLSAMNYEFLQAVIERELRRRDEEGEIAADLTPAATTDNNETYNDLPNSWKAWLDGMEASNEATLQSVLDNVANGQGQATYLTIEQRDYVVGRIRAELSSRGGAPNLTPSGEWPRPWNGWVQNLQFQDESNLRNVRATMSDAEASRDSSLSAEQKRELINMIDDEFRRRLAASIRQGEEVQAARANQQEFDFDSQAHEPEPQDPRAAQQAELVNRDDPVTSNDPEAQTYDHEIYNTETNQVISVAPNSQLDYAVSKARSQEQDLGLPAGTLQVRRRNQTNESLINILKLAGLR